MLLGIVWQEWLGYAASALVAISLTMSSIVKLRWLNLTGAVMFAAYGFIIGALPVAFVNSFIIVVNVVYLRRMYREKDDFRIMNLSVDSEYLQYFLECHRKEIVQYFPQFNFVPQSGRRVFFLVKNSVPIGLLIGSEQADGAFMIELDYVGQAYRDFKMGSFVYQNNEFFRQQGFKSLIAPVTEGKHDDYLRKMNFRQDGVFFVKSLLAAA